MKQSLCQTGVGEGLIRNWLRGALGQVERGWPRRVAHVPSTWDSWWRNCPPCGWWGPSRFALIWRRFENWTKTANWEEFIIRLVVMVLNRPFLQKNYSQNIFEKYGIMISIMQVVLLSVQMTPQHVISSHLRWTFCGFKVHVIGHSIKLWDKFKLNLDKP